MGKKFNFFKDVVDPLGKRLKPVAKPIIGALTNKVLEGINASTMPTFKTGGRVKGKRGAAKIAKVHGGEYVLPVGIEPTMAQKRAVAKRKARAKK